MMIFFHYFHNYTKSSYLKEQITSQTINNSITKQMSFSQGNQSRNLKISMIVFLVK